MATQQVVEGSDQPRAAQGNGDEAEGREAAPTNNSVVPADRRGPLPRPPQAERSRSEENTPDVTSVTSPMTSSIPMATETDHVHDDRRAAAQREFDLIDADRREYNLIIHGIPETDRTGDDDAIYEMLNHLQCGHRARQIENTFRLGRKQYRRNRMLLIQFDNKTAVNEVLDKAPRLTNSVLFRNFFIRRDLPVAQRRQGRNQQHFYDSAQGSRGSGPRTQDSPTTPVHRHEDLQNLINAERESRSSSPSSEIHRSRRLSIQSYSSIDSDLIDLESVSSFEENDSDELSEIQIHNTQYVEPVPMYMKIGDQFFLVTDSYDENNIETNLDDENVAASSENQMDTFHGDRIRMPV